MIQDFQSHDEVLEYAARLIEDTDISDLRGVWAKRKRDREDAALRLKTAEDVRRRCASEIRAMKNRPDLGPIETLRRMSTAADGHCGHAAYLREAWPLAWKGWVEIECFITTARTSIPPETRYRITLTDKGREILADAEKTAPGA